MALGEPEVRERQQLVVNRIRRLAGDVTRRHPGVEALTQPFHPLMAALGAHRLTQLVRLGRCEAGHLDRDLHHLLLEQRHAQRLVQRPLEQRMQVGDFFLSVVPADERMHRPTLDRTGTDERDLDHQVVEVPGLQPWQRGHLGSALDLEQPDRVGAAQHAVDSILLWDHRQIDRRPLVGGDQVNRTMQRFEHPQAQQVELDQADRRAVVLVPLQHAAVGHRRPLDRADVDHRPVADHHAAGVDAQMTREALQLRRQVDHRCGYGVRRGGRGRIPRRGGDLAERSPPVELSRPPVQLPGGEAQRPAGVADRRPGPVGDDVGDLRGVMAAVAAVDVLDDLLAPPALDVQVDVGGPVACR